MFLKNYTSGVPVAQTIGKIERVLIRCGVQGITKEYLGTDGTVTALMFHLEIPGQPVATVRLAPKIEAAQRALWTDYAGKDLQPDGKLKWNSHKRRTLAAFLEQAERTAWRLLQDRIEVEMSLIELKQRDVVQAFMADVWNGQQTFYESLKVANFRGLLPEKSSSET